MSYGYASSTPERCKSSLGSQPALGKPDASAAPDQCHFLPGWQSKVLKPPTSPKHSQSATKQKMTDR